MAFTPCVWEEAMTMTVIMGVLSFLNFVAQPLPPPLQPQPPHIEPQQEHLLGH